MFNYPISSQLVSFLVYAFALLYKFIADLFYVTYYKHCLQKYKFHESDFVFSSDTAKPSWFMFPHRIQPGTITNNLQNNFLILNFAIKLFNLFGLEQI